MSLEHSTFKTLKKSFDKTIEVPSSKSYANRLLILAALSPEAARVSNLPLSSDVETMINCFNAIGLDCERSGSDVIVHGQFPNCESDGEELIVLETGDGGTTNRFLLPFLSLGSRRYELRAIGHMRQRPMQDLVDGLIHCGATITYNPTSDKSVSWITVKGPIEAKEVEIDCSQTTQFLTGMALALSSHDQSVKPKNLSVSLPYWNLTKTLIEKAKIERKQFENPVDFSSLSYPLALAAVSGRVKVSNCFETDVNQADSMFLPLLEKMGAKIEWTKEGLVCERGELKGISFDGSQCPDVIPTLIFTCSFAKGISELTNLEVLTHKECDRFEEMIRLLVAAGIHHDFDRKNYSLTIHGHGLPNEEKDFDFDPVADHRMVMVTYLFQRILGGGHITNNAHHVKKSFANFFEVMS